MPEITDIRTQKTRKDRVNVFIDGRYAFALDQISAYEARLEVGQDVSEERLNELVDKAGLDSAMSVALRYLTSRPRSERELRDRLRRRQVGEAVIDRTVEKLKTKGLLDDFTFAQYWVDQRVTFRPRSRRMLEMELRQKGVDGEAIEGVTLDMDDEAEAYRAAQRRARSLPANDFDTFFKKLVDHLRRRGFGYATAAKTARGYVGRADVTRGIVNRGSPRSPPLILRLSSARAGPLPWGHPHPSPLPSREL